MQGCRGGAGGGEQQADPGWLGAGGAGPRWPVTSGRPGLGPQPHLLPPQVRGRQWGVCRLRGPAPPRPPGARPPPPPSSGQGRRGGARSTELAGIRRSPTPPLGPPPPEPLLQAPPGGGGPASAQLFSRPGVEAPGVTLSTALRFRGPSQSTAGGSRSRA